MWVGYVFFLGVSKETHRINRGRPAVILHTFMLYNILCCEDSIVKSLYAFNCSCDSVLGSTSQIIYQSYYLQIPPLKFWISKNIFLFLKENKGKLVRYRYPPLKNLEKNFSGGVSVGNRTDSQNIFLEAQMFFENSRNMNSK